MKKTRSQDMPPQAAEGRSRRARPRPVLFVLYTLVIAALACNRGGQINPATQAAQTVEAVLTASALAPVALPDTPTVAPATELVGGPSATPGEEPTVAQSKPTDTAAPTNTPGAQGCVDGAQYVADVTVPDDTVFAPGATFTKTWRLKNTGTCTWVGSYAYAFVGGEAMGGPPSVSVTGNVAPGSQYDVSVNLKAPATPGTYKGTWQMRNSGGALFGTKPFVQIVVAAPTATATATQSASNTPTVTATTSGGPWNGTWETDCGIGLCGEMNLVQTGSTVVGTYSGGDGTINGTVSDNHLSGTWSRGGDSGTLDFWLGSGGNRWRGNWDKVNDWCGNRSGLSEPSPCGVASWYGTWTTQCSGSTCGDMTLTQTGATITGTYAGGEGSVTGSVDGTELTGTWMRNGTSGTLKFFMISGGVQFQGNYDGSFDWCGYRSGSSAPGTCFRS
jgi:Ig-like domain from next to BRCA1 gene